MVDVFLYIVDRCDLTGEELVALIEKYERDSVVVAMNEEYEPNLTNEVAIFRDLYRAAQRTTRPCSSVYRDVQGDVQEGEKRMSLFPCRACGHEVYRTAKTCPHLRCFSSRVSAAVFAL